MFDAAGGKICVKQGSGYVRCHANAVSWFDHAENRFRPTTGQDLINITKISDMSPLIEVTAPACIENDAPLKYQTLFCARDTLSYTNKPMELAPQNLQELIHYIEIDKAIRGVEAERKPRFDVAVSTTSPLQLDSDTSDNLIYSAEHGLPLHIAPCPVGGAASPVTLAGTLLLTCCENLFLLTVAQILHPGLGIIWGGSPTIMDLQTLNIAYGSPETSLIVMANAQLARYYGLPCATVTGGADVCKIDVQGGSQKMLGFLTRALSGSCFFAGVGCIDSARAISSEQLLCDLAILETVLRYIRGIEFDGDATAIDVIKNVPHGGSYIAEEHTLSWHRQEILYSQLYNREGPDKPDMLERASVKAREMLDSYICPVDADTCKRIEKYVADQC